MSHRLAADSRPLSQDELAAAEPAAAPISAHAGLSIPGCFGGQTDLRSWSPNCADQSLMMRLSVEKWAAAEAHASGVAVVVSPSATKSVPVTVVFDQPERLQGSGATKLFTHARVTFDGAPADSGLTVKDYDLVEVWGNALIQ